MIRLLNDIFNASIWIIYIGFFLKTGNVPWHTLQVLLKIETNLSFTKKEYLTHVNQFYFPININIRANNTKSHHQSLVLKIEIYSVKLSQFIALWFHFNKWCKDAFVTHLKRHIIFCVFWFVITNLIKSEYFKLVNHVCVENCYVYIKMRHMFIAWCLQCRFEEKKSFLRVFQISLLYNTIQYAEIICFEHFKITEIGKNK